MWKEAPGVNGKTKKRPYYVNGKMRKGLLDTEADLKQLVSLSEAYDEFMMGSYSGIGFALTGGDGIGAFDMDHILEDGKLIKTHPGYDLVLAAKEAGAYIEVSPSGEGLRIVGPCQNQEAYSKGGLEYWGAKRFVTLTGECWANPGGWVDLDEFRNPLAAPREPRDEQDDVDPTIITQRTLDELKSALDAMDSDERTLWVDIGMALKTIGDKGLELWLEWSAKSKKFNRADAMRVWDSFNPQGTNYKAVFAKAQRDWGWDNPRKGKSRSARDAFGAEDDEEEVDTDQTIDLGEMKLYPTEFILDGFLPAQVSVIAGAWGAGKSTNLIPLMASAAHLAPEEWGFHPILRRHVLWVTEAPEQARDTLYSLAKDPQSAPWDEFKRWFHLLPAKRLPPKKIASKIRKLVESMSYELENGFQVKPVVVLDTTTANLDLENESDNSMVGAAMSILKQALPKTPIVLIGHTPKALTKGEVGDMTFRGAGAWEAEAAATYFLIYDQDAEMRFLAIRKARFTPNYREIDFGQAGGSEIIDTEWGEPQAKAYLHGVPVKSDGSARKSAREEAAEERRETVKERTLSERQGKVLDHVRKGTEGHRFVTRASLRSSVGGKAEMVLEAIERLLEANLIEAHIPNRDQLGADHRGRTPEIFLLAGVDLDLWLGKAKGSNGSGRGGR